MDTHRDDELIIARPLSNLSRSAAPDANIQTSSKTSPHSESHVSKPQHSHRVISRPEEPSPGHIQIRLVSAALARSHAKESLKEGSEPTNGVLAFDGQFISGHTSLVCFPVMLRFPVLSFLIFLRRTLDDSPTRNSSNIRLDFRRHCG
jgi:hypothetical protein